MDMYSHSSPFLSSHIARSLNETTIVNITLPHSTGTTLQDEIQCYSIPYGLVGFISHLASYYTLAITAVGRKPLAPWSRLKQKNRIVSILQLVGTMGLALYTIYACHDRWQFVLIALWKLVLNAGKGGWQITTGWMVSGQQSIARASQRAGGNRAAGLDLAWRSGSLDRKSGNVMRRIAGGYALAALVGLVGVADLVRLAAHQTPHILTITEAFGGTVAFALVCGIGLAIVDKDLEAAFIMPLLAIMVLFALYSDWILGAIADNLLGNPRENRAFYWVSRFGCRCRYFLRQSIINSVTLSM